MKSNKFAAEDIIVSHDIGTRTVCEVAGVKNEHGKLEILGVGKVPCDGVIRGVFSNIEKTGTSIREAIQIVERKIDGKVKIDHVGIAGQHIKSLRQHGILDRKSVV